MKKGLIHLYCGNGKGKTTAAMGLALRAVGNGMRVLIIQFLKSSPSGEITVLSGLPGVTVWRGKGSGKFLNQMNEEEITTTRQMDDQFLQQGIEAAYSGKYDLLILDEAVGCAHADMLDTKLLLELLHNKPEGLELVLTGRNPTDEMLEAADYVTEMTLRKHPFQQGIGAREGVEY